MAEEKVAHEEGFVEVNGLKLFYERFGKGNPRKLLALHGGPGGTHDYLLPLKDMSKMGFDVVFYDQFGCGKSDDPKKESDYSLEYAVEEVEGARKAFFGDSKINLFGNSWGGMLSLAYAIKYQKNLITLTSSSGLSSIPDTVSEMHRLISLLPDQYRKGIEEHEEKGEYDHPDFVEATEFFMRQHVLRIDTWPQEVTRMLEMTEKRGTYLKMNGPSEFTIVGLIKDIDFTPDLHKITVPTLLTCGRYDEVTPEIQKKMNGEIASSRVEVFEDSSHLQFWEERDLYMRKLAEFIQQYDR